MAWWCIERPDGEQVTVEGEPSEPLWSPIARKVEVPGPPEPGEVWDFAAGSYKMDVEKALAADDITHLNVNGQLAIAVAHALKCLEARMMLAGVTIDGQVAAEAKALKILPAMYARSVVDRAKAERNVELERIVRKAEIRKNGGANAGTNSR